MPDFFDPPDDHCVNTSVRRMYLYDGSGTSPAVLLATPPNQRPVVGDGFLLCSRTVKNGINVVQEKDHG